MVKDPVCKMEVDEKKAKFRTTYKGRDYYFCSEACKEKFDNTVNNLKKAGGGICFGVRIEEEKEAMK
jgi:YHS domain-containing protein